MERIPAASNVIIEVQPQSWRLLSSSDETEQVLVEAVPGEPLRYGSGFGSRRRLPEAGTLQPEDIQRVVLGWSSKDAAWHLGLLLNGDLAAARGSRWCGLAHWYDPQANRLQDAAIQAGQALAEQVSRPFTMIPPETNGGASAAAPVSPAAPSPYEVPAPYTTDPEESPAQPIPQPALPIRFDPWMLRPFDASRLELWLSPSWGRGKLLRAAWYIVWLGVFIVLTVATLTSEIALPRPEILVYLGFVSMFVLLIAIFRNLYSAATATNRVVFERAGVRWLRGKRVKRTLPVSAIQAVYASHIVSKVGKRNNKDRSVRYGELNLLLTDGSFVSLVSQPQTDDKIPVTDDALDEEFVVPLNEYNARTHLQAAGLMIARALDVPAEYDKRVR